LKHPLLLVLTICASFVSYETRATTYVPKTVDEILEKTVAIKVIQIVEGRLVRVEYKNESKDCGFVYVGDIEDNLLGDGDSVEFLAERSLRIGRKYIVFLTDGNTAGQDMMSTNSMMWPAIKEEMEIREICESRYSGLKAIRGLTSEFKSHRFVRFDDEWINEPWVEASEFFSERHSVSLYEFEAETIKIYAPEEEVVTVVGDELLDDSTRAGGAKYPYVWLNEMLMKWEDYRAAIIAELTDLETSVSREASDSE